jgi:excinuclease ABC subunit A
VRRALLVDQSPIGRTPRSNPVTYVKAYAPVRELFAGTAEAKRRGYAPARFSFNVPGGRCSSCEGMGYNRIEMHFMADVFVRCPACEGRRFNPDTLEVRFRGLDVSEVLSLTVDEAMRFFHDHPAVGKRLWTLQRVGLGYLRLGQPATTLSGGEAQRIKIARELGQPEAEHSLYVFDEPTTGLHMHDVARLLDVLSELVSRGHSVIVIEHNLDVIRAADHVIDLGPEGGDEGGAIVVEGTPEQVAACPDSHTGRFLRKRRRVRAGARR